MRTHRHDNPHGDSHDNPHPPLRHPATLVGAAAALVAALLGTGCDPAPGAAAASEAKGAGAAFSAVRFAVDARGGIQVSGASRTAVAPAGTHVVSAGRAHPFARPAGKLLVVLRHWPQAVTERASRAGARAPELLPPEEVQAETGFLVDTAQWVRADLDGHPLQWLRRDTIRIDTTNAASGDLARLTLSAPHGGRPGQPAPPPSGPACVDLDQRTNRNVVLPAVEAGAPVTDVLASLRTQCLKVQYASHSGGARPGTVRQILVPLTGQPLAVAVAPPPDGIDVPGRTPGSTVRVDPGRPATIVVAR
ncbi:hypothetical protein [Streptomyces sp. NBC_00038]|uniref:hypothetical protein n=1 Tax=Streptomyces sp. NBC_00038 TaxID=2903615 RepID=UPI0022536F26|nr:hypothetical protein [Streptomyces sp. NBC_00038]MCX5557140.1 hypothetical protein [Streptomyces sp. NBC_00038]